MVPLTMPMIRRMRSPASDSRSGRISGMPPATADSKSRSTPAVEAASKSSAPQLASSSLLAVTTGLPDFRASRIRVRAGSMPPMTSTTTSTVGIDHHGAWRRWSGCPSGTGASRSRDRLRTATAASSRSQAGAGRDAVAVLDEQAHQRSADVAAAQQPDPQHRRLHAAKGSGRTARGRVARLSVESQEVVERLAADDDRWAPSRTNTTGGRGTLL